MKEYIHLLQEFLALGGYDTSHLKYGDTDLISLKEGEELLVIFNDDGTEDLFIIFDQKGATITFGEWADFLEGTSLSSFEYLVEIIAEILKGNYYVREIRLDAIEIAALVCEETDQIINTYIVSGTEELKSMNAFEFVHGLDYSEAYFNEVRWEYRDEDEDDFYWWDEDYDDDYDGDYDEYEEEDEDEEELVEDVD